MYDTVIFVIFIVLIFIIYLFDHKHRKKVIMKKILENNIKQNNSEFTILDLKKKQDFLIKENENLRKTIKEQEEKINFLEKIIDNFNILLNYNNKQNLHIECGSDSEVVNTINCSKLLYSTFEKKGINIYTWKRKCYKCGDTINIFSYYLLYQYYQITKDSSLQQYTEKGLGDCEVIDKFIASRYPTIKLRKSKAYDDFYYANTCKNCGSLQGKNYVVSDPHEVFDYVVMLSPPDDNFSIYENYTLEEIGISEDDFATMF